MTGADAAKDIELRFAALDDLTAGELHDILKLRFDVFVLEQQSLYPEIDGEDPLAVHMTAKAGAELAGVLRILQLGGDGPAQIGRVALAIRWRGRGLGKSMIEAALAHIRASSPGQQVVLGAQLHLERFYKGFGFERTSDVYDDGGIPHVDMALSAERS